MSTAYPRFDAIEDSSIGLSGGHLRVPYIIELDAVGDDPYTPLITAAPLGSAPNVRTRVIGGSLSGTVANRFSGLVVTEYESPRLLNEKTFQAYVVYGPASDRTIGLWRRSVRFASETKPFTWSLPELNANGNTTPGGFPKFVGSHEYKLTKAANSRYSVTLNEDGAAVPKKVERTGWVRSANLAINDGITSIVYDILTPQLPPTKIRKLSSAKWSCNQFDWLGYERWSLVFANWDCHDEVLVLPGSNPTVAWYSNVSIELLYKELDPDTNPFGWRAIKHYELFDNDKGNGAQVYDNSTGSQIPVSETYVQYPHTPFETIFQIIGGSPQV